MKKKYLKNAAIAAVIALCGCSSGSMPAADTAVTADSVTAAESTSDTVSVAEGTPAADSTESPEESAESGETEKQIPGAEGLEGIAKEKLGELSELIPADFDGDGTEEAFAISKDGSEVCFVNGNGDVSTVLSGTGFKYAASSDTASKLGIEGSLDINGQHFITLFAKGEKEFALLSGVKDGEAFLPDTGEDFSAFKADESGLFGVKPLGGHFFLCPVDQNTFETKGNGLLDLCGRYADIVLDNEEKWLSVLNDPKEHFDLGLMDLDGDDIPEFTVCGGIYGAHAAMGYFIYGIDTENGSLDMLLTQNEVTYADEPNIFFWNRFDDGTGMPLCVSVDVSTGERRFFSIDHDAVAYEGYTSINEYSFGDKRISVTKKYVATEKFEPQVLPDGTTEAKYTFADETDEHSIVQIKPKEYAAFYDELTNPYNKTVTMVGRMCSEEGLTLDIYKGLEREDKKELLISAFLRGFEKETPIPADVVYDPSAFFLSNTLDTLPDEEFIEMILDLK